MEARVLFPEILNYDSKIRDLSAKLLANNIANHKPVVSPKLSKAKKRRLRQKLKKCAMVMDVSSDQSASFVSGCADDGGPRDGLVTVMADLPTATEVGDDGLVAAKRRRVAPNPFAETDVHSSSPSADTALELKVVEAKSLQRYNFRPR